MRKNIFVLVKRLKWDFIELRREKRLGLSMRLGLLIVLNLWFYCLKNVFKMLFCVVNVNYVNKEIVEVLLKRKEDCLMERYWIMC